MAGVEQRKEEGCNKNCRRGQAQGSKNRHRARVATQEGERCECAEGEGKGGKWETGVRNYSYIGRAARLNSFLSFFPRLVELLALVISVQRGFKTRSLPRWKLVGVSHGSLGAHQ